MASKTQITGRLVAAARALTGVSRKDLAHAAGISHQKLSRMESSGSAELRSGAETNAVRRALEEFGAVFLFESDGFGAGVRLKFTRQDVRQIDRFEDEGGPSVRDDAP